MKRSLSALARDFALSRTHRAATKAKVGLELTDDDRLWAARLRDEVKSRLEQSQHSPRVPRELVKDQQIRELLEQSSVPGVAEPALEELSNETAGRVLKLLDKLCSQVRLSGEETDDLLRSIEKMRDVSQREFALPETIS